MPIATLVPPAPVRQPAQMPKPAANQQGEPGSFSREMTGATEKNRPQPAEPVEPEAATVQDRQEENPEDAVYAQSVLASAAAAVHMEAQNVQEAPEDAPDQILAIVDGVTDAPQGIEGISPEALLPMADTDEQPQTADFAPLLETTVMEMEAEANPQINILEGFVPVDGTDAREALFAGETAVMDDPGMAESSAAARMPEGTPKQARTDQPSFLENVDDMAVTIEPEGDEPPPPGRVEDAGPAREAETMQPQAPQSETPQPEAPVHATQAMEAREDAAPQNNGQDGAAEGDVPDDHAEQKLNANTQVASAAPAQTSVFTPDAAQEPQAAPAQPFEQIALETTLNQGVGRNQFVMRLQPETLGEVTVRLVLASDGVIARISVTNDNARAALSDQLYQLGDSMRAKGIDVRSIELVQDYTGQSAMLHDGNRGAPDQNPTPRWKQTRYASGAEAVAALEGYDQALVAQITVGDTQTVSFDA